MATLVETKELVETVVASVVAGVGITTIFSVAIWGGARFADLSRGGRRCCGTWRSGAAEHPGCGGRRHPRDDEQVEHSPRVLCSRIRPKNQMARSPRAAGGRDVQLTDPCRTCETPRS